MTYGGNKWAKRRGPARRAGKRKKSSTKTAKRRRAPSVRRAKKSTKRKSAKRTSKRRTTKKRASSRVVAFYSVDTGKKVAVAKRDYADAYADPGLTTKKPRMVYRYNPDTGRKQRFADTSEEAEQWSAKKPPKGAAGILLRGYQKGGAAGAALVGQKVTERVIRASSRKINTAVKKLVASGMGAAGLTATTSAAVIAAGLVAYGLGSQAFYPQATTGLKLDAALRNYVALRRSLATRLGRPLTRDELRTLFAKYQETVVRIKSHDPTVNQRPGRE